MKFLKILTILSVVLFILTAIAVILGLIKFINGISPLIFGISFLATTTSLHLIKYNQSKMKWFVTSLAAIGFIVLSLATFKILEMKDFWLTGSISLSISILIGLFYQIQLVTMSKGKFYILGLLMTILLIGFLLLASLQLENPKIYYTGKVVLAIFTIFSFVGSLLKPKKIIS